MVINTHTHMMRFGVDFPRELGQFPGSNSSAAPACKVEGLVVGDVPIHSYGSILAAGHKLYIEPLFRKQPFVVRDQLREALEGGRRF